MRITILERTGGIVATNDGEVSSTRRHRVYFIVLVCARNDTHAEWNGSRTKKDATPTSPRNCCFN